MYLEVKVGGFVGGSVKIFWGVLWSGKLFVSLHCQCAFFYEVEWFNEKLIIVII